MLSSTSRYHKEAEGCISPPPHGKRRLAGCGNFDPMSVFPLQHVWEFSDEQLTVSAGKLFGQASREEVNKKPSMVKTHQITKKLADSKKRHHKKVTHERDITQALVMPDESHPHVETLPTDQWV